MDEEKLLGLDPVEVEDFCRSVLLRGFRRNPMVITHLEDLLQDCALAATRQSRKNSPPIRNARAWLVRVAVNAVYRLWRTEKVFAGAEQGADDEQLPATETICLEDRLAVRAALEALDPEIRALLWERDALGTSRREMAERLQISSNALGVRLHRARRKLLAVLDRKGLQL